MDPNKLLTDYNSKITQLSSRLPLSEGELEAAHDKILDEIKAGNDLNSVPSLLQTQIKAEFPKLIKMNEDLFLDNLRNFIVQEVGDIEESLQQNKFGSVEEYKGEFEDFMKTLVNRAPEGPNREQHINEFGYQILQRQSEDLLQNLTRDLREQIEQINKQIEDINNDVENIKVNSKELNLNI